MKFPLNRNKTSEKNPKNKINVMNHTDVEIDNSLVDLDKNLNAIKLSASQKNKPT